jgi:hypothetical protein
MLVKKSDDDFDIGWNEEILAEFGEALAKFEYLLEIFANDKEALVREVKTLTAKFGASEAQIMEELMVQASQNEALAKKISKLSSELNGNTASITETLTTLVTDQQALAELVTELDVEFSGNIATINSTLTTLANADSALASDVTTLEARLDTGDFAAVKVQSSATASKVTGIEARWGVTTNVNGNVAGIQLLNGTNTQSSFTVDATKFVVKKPNGTNGIVWNGALSRLDISGSVYADAFFGNVIGTSNVNSGAITGSASTSAGSGNLSLNFTSTGGPVYVFAQALLDSSPIGCTLYVNGSAVREDFVVAGGDRKTPAFIYLWQPAAGTYNYSLIGSSSTLTTPNLMVLETKR